VAASDLRDTSFYFSELRRRTHILEKALLSSSRSDLGSKIAAVRNLLGILNSQLDGRNGKIVDWSKQMVDTALHGRLPAQEIRGTELPRGNSIELTTAILQRRSIRAYSDTPVSFADICEILESGLWAPSGCNRQPLEFLCIWDKDDIKFCKNIAGEGNAFPMTAAFAVVALVDVRNYALPVERHMIYLDAGACIQNMLLRAHSLGIGSCWLFWNDRSGRLRDFWGRFKIKPYLLPVSMVCFGFPKSSATPPPRKSLNSAIRFSEKDGDSFREYIASFRSVI
jgi:nitroreductase